MCTYTRSSSIRPSTAALLRPLFTQHKPSPKKNNFFIAFEGAALRTAVYMFLLRLRPQMPAVACFDEAPAVLPLEQRAGGTWPMESTGQPPDLG